MLEVKSQPLPEASDCHPQAGASKYLVRFPDAASLFESDQLKTRDPVKRSDIPGPGCLVRSR